MKIIIPGFEDFIPLHEKLRDSEREKMVRNHNKKCKENRLRRSKK